MSGDEEFFDELYRLWARTTGSEDRWWEPEHIGDSTHRHNVYAVDGEGSRTLVARDMPERDAEFIAGLHGALPDLIRLLRDALDEAARADYDRDSRECRIAELEMELVEMKQIVSNLSKNPPWHQRG